MASADFALHPRKIHGKHFGRVQTDSESRGWFSESLIEWVWGGFYKPSEFSWQKLQGFWLEITHSKGLGSNQKLTMSKDIKNLFLFITPNQEIVLFFRRGIDESVTFRHFVCVLISANVACCIFFVVCVFFYNLSSTLPSNFFLSVPGFRNGFSRDHWKCNLDNVPTSSTTISARRRV